MTKLYEKWNDNDIEALATASFFQDLALEKRHQQFDDLRATFGKLQNVTPFAAENNLRGRWSMLFKKGRIEAYVTLSPTVPPRMQVLQLTSAKNLTPAFSHIVKQLVGIINQWDAETAKSLFVASVKRKDMQRQFDALRVRYGGKLSSGDLLEGNGDTWAVVRLAGGGQGVDMKVTLDAKSKRVGEILFTRPRETAFVP